MANKTIKELRCERAMEFAEKARERFKAFGYYYETEPVADEVHVDITWGDWKHDHLWVDRQMAAIGLTKVNEILTEQDGSDCYSAIHIFTPAAL